MEKFLVKVSKTVISTKDFKVEVELGSNQKAIELVKELAQKEDWGTEGEVSYDIVNIQACDIEKTAKELAVEFLEALVHERMTEKELNCALSNYFGKEIEVVNVSALREGANDSDELSDFNYMFEVNTEEIQGDFDIYVLPMRRDDKLYITEVGYEFQ